MVCIPCFIVPVLLLLWKKFIEPYVWPHVYKYWYGVEYKKDDSKPFNCDGGKCIFAGKSKETLKPENHPEQATEASMTNKKDD